MEPVKKGHPKRRVLTQVLLRFRVSGCQHHVPLLGSLVGARIPKRNHAFCQAFVCLCMFELVFVCGGAVSVLVFVSRVLNCLPSPRESTIELQALSC